MGIKSDLKLSAGCRDRLMVASSVAAIAALVVSVLGLVRAVFDVTWPLGASWVCPRPEPTEPDHTASMWLRTAPNLTNRAGRAMIVPKPTLTPTLTVPSPDPTITAVTMASSPVPSTALTVTAGISAQMVYSDGGAYPYQAPVLLQPEPDGQLGGVTHFEWEWNGQPLRDGMAFDLLIWSEAEHEAHEGLGAYGVTEPQQSLGCEVDLDYVQTIIENGAGTYFWTMIVVREEPYERLGAWGEKRPFIYVPPELPAEPTGEGG